MLDVLLARSKFVQTVYGGRAVLGQCSLHVDEDTQFICDPGLAKNMNNPAFFAGNPKMGINGIDGMSHYSFANVMNPVVDISRFLPNMVDIRRLSTNIWGAFSGEHHEQRTTEGLFGTFVFGASRRQVQDDRGLCEFDCRDLRLAQAVHLPEDARPCNELHPQEFPLCTESLGSRFGRLQPMFGISYGIPFEDLIVKEMEGINIKKPIDVCKRPLRMTGYILQFSGTKQTY
ncbi:hypothetical protein DFJ58DRAFT_839146 [Suillus subalutaceus]|uniref:uncharacterized protein n=1 Tax=Suillus subalutaceus TaxID=48586 RepID=UPI001B8801C9|nr:uncharacterized protein DFJ58DRAFT_839146 [Suillus subalutaceus]KAG1863637.1 hypothetical protein DFJ58DRAFT_839146 [Suillus subalutaceus]